MDDAKSVAEEPRISLVTSLSSEAFVLLESEAKREGKPIGEVLDRLILEGCILDEGLPLESHIVDLEKLNKRPETSFDKFNPI